MYEVVTRKGGYTERLPEAPIFEERDHAEQWARDFLQRHPQRLEVAPWSLDVSGPSGFLKSENRERPGRLEFVAPQSGEYAFSVGPTAIWGNRGMFAVCGH